MAKENNQRRKVGKPNEHGNLTKKISTLEEAEIILVPKINPLSKKSLQKSGTLTSL